MQTRKLIKVIIESSQIGDDKDVLRIEWNFPDDEDYNYYFVDKRKILGYINPIRSALNDLVNNFNPERFKLMMKSELPNCGKELQKLAKLGYKFYKSLFTEKRAIYSMPVAKIRKMLESLNESKYRIHFITRVQNLHIPWGLVFCVDPSTLNINERNIDIEYYRHFWANKFLVSSAYELNGVGYSANEPIPIESFTMFPFLNKSVYHKTKSFLTPTEDKLSDYIFENLYKAIYSGKVLDERKKELAENVKQLLLYFYGHSDSDQLILDETESLLPNDLVTFDDDINLNGPELNTHFFVFLNGCKTATGDINDNFSYAFEHPAFTGFIGTEGKIPGFFAFRFGLTFLHEYIFEGEPIYLIMEKLRKNHWPLSLLYKINCRQSFRISPSNENIEQSLKYSYNEERIDTNFCIPLSSNRDSFND